MPNYYATKRISEALKEHGHAVDVRLLGQQPQEGFKLAPKFGEEFIYFERYETDDPIPFMWQTPLRNPSGKYDLYAPERITEYYQDVYGRDLPEPKRVYTIPTKTDMRVNIETSVKRVQELTFEEISKEMGLAYDKKFENLKDIVNVTEEMFADHWNARYAKPRKTKDGKGYESYPYDISEPYLRWGQYIEEDLSVEPMVLKYKGLPLMIYANPAIEVHKLTVEV